MNERIETEPEIHHHYERPGAGRGFVLGVAAVIVALVVGAAAYLVVSDDDDDGNVDVDVPAVDAELPGE